MRHSLNGKASPFISTSLDLGVFMKGKIEVRILGVSPFYLGFQKKIIMLDNNLHNIIKLQKDIKTSKQQRIIKKNGVLFLNVRGDL